jgi:hypothetical protein
VKREFFIILNASGGLKKRRTYLSGSIYPDKSVAISQARSDGDSVVAIMVDSDVEPVFIRHLVIGE